MTISRPFVRVFSALLAALMLSSCRLVILPDGDGRVASASGERDCATAECSFEIDQAGFEDNFTAVPGNQQVFAGWKGVCGRPGFATCELAVPEEWVVEDFEGQLKPVFEASTFYSDVELIAAEPRPAGSANHLSTRQLCADRLAELGYEVRLQHYSTGTNVIGTLPGSKEPEELVIVSAHYDSEVRCRGADDNASGVAAVLEVARLLAGTQHDRTLELACWDEEELGLIGSTYYARNLPPAQDVVMNYVFEMIGYVSSVPNSQQLPFGVDLLFPEEVAQLRQNDNRGDFVALVYDQAGAGEHLRDPHDYAELLGLPVMSLGIPSSQMGVALQSDFARSDHAPFWREGYAAVMITDTAEFRNPNYHCRRGEDDPDTLDVNFAVKVINATTELVKRSLQAGS